MMRAMVSVVAVVCTLACSAATMTTSQAQASRPPAVDEYVKTSLDPTDADWDWFHEYVDKALEALMPLKTAPLVLAYRSEHDLLYSVKERYFGVSPAIARLYGVTVVVPIEQSVQHQLMALHMADRSASFESVLARIKVRRMTFNVETCPAIWTQIDRLADVSVRMPDFRPSTEIRFHGTFHRVVTSYIDVAERDDRSPIGRWANQTFDAFWTCGVAAGKYAPPRLRLSIRFVFSEFPGSSEPGGGAAGPGSCATCWATSMSREAGGKEDGNRRQRLPKPVP